MQFSVSLTLDRDNDRVDLRDVIRHTVEMAQIAEDAGFSIVWVGEHHTIEANVGPAPFQMLTQIANHTSTVRLGTACVVAPYWHPIKLAGEAAFFDMLSGGRLELGIGRGAYQYEFDRMANGIPQKQGMAFVEEIVPAVRALWAGDYAHQGKFWSFPEATSVPKPLQPEVPIWIAARDPATYDWALQHGLNIHSWAITRPFSEFLSYKERFENAFARSGRTQRPKFMTMRHTHVYEEDDGWQIAVDSLISRNGLFESLFRNEGGVKNGFPTSLDLFSLRHSEEYSAESLRTNLVFGKPDEVIAKLKAYEAAGVDDFCYYAGFGLPPEEQKKSLALFGREVIPAFKAG
ncbi:LLM class flavin-dependent oxidoreductase [Rhodobacter sp. SGA-6-6]|uniref:LLM class flavin-dependent oxidoreductase n=1 Tax=Rhodobacter sp. SGA-6-6 TaxID=2710882 RepID=UPI0013ED5AA8|nr:LLM class flavin-dependent oxidoreductase [Rhodobacter sp. SGA-6-6]NGM44087.1 LLM class flavin-dependent oxidoreductase [Rhodobacter sp. SGA-6-6]